MRFFEFSFKHDLAIQLHRSIRHSGRSSKSLRLLLARVL